MSEAGESSEEPERPAELHYVLAGNAINYDYEIGALAVGDGDSRRTISVILVAPLEERTLAIFPSKAWDKKPNKRKLPTGPFTKPVLVEVACASPFDRTALSPEGPAKVWFGMLARQLAEQVVYDSGEAPDIPFGTSGAPLLPYAPALLELAENQFGFQSALSSAGQPAAAADPFEARFRALVSTLGRLSESVQQLVDRDGLPKNSLGARAKAAPRAKATAKNPAAGAGSIPGTPAPPGKAREVPGLDPAVVKAALDSGVSAFELKELGNLMSKGRPALGDFPAAPAEPVLGEGSEFGGSAAENAEGPDHAAPGPPVEQAVLVLTGLMKQLVQDKRKPADRAASREAALDVAEGTVVGEASGSSGFGRSKGAAYRLLRDSLEKSPELIFQEIERLLDEDLLSRRAVGALSSAQSSARAWVEFRSRVGYYPTTIRTMWCLGGILDALRDDRVAEARARTCLALAALDQACIDAGSWAYAQEILLESPPPLGSFQGRRTLADPLKSYHTRLLSGRWSDLLLHRVKEVESFLEAKKKLGRNRGGDQGGRGAGEEASSDPGGKGRGRGGKGNPGHPAASDKTGPLGGPGEVVPFACAAGPVSCRAMPLPETAATSFAACSFANSLAELLADGNLSFCLPSGRWPQPLVDSAFFTASLTCCEAASSATASCEPTALRLAAQLLDSFFAMPLHRVSRGAACSPFSLRGPRPSSACMGRCWSRLASLLNAWVSHPPVGLEDMGRAAGKVEKIEQQLSALQRASETSAVTLPSLAPAKDVEPARLSFPARPQFDPCPFLDDQLRALYVDPAAAAVPFAELPFDPPKARDKQARLELLALLDASDRLVLFPADGESLQSCCGLFAVPKSQDRDRLIVDARPGNMVQPGDNRWLALMPTAACLLGLELQPQEALCPTPRPARLLPQFSDNPQPGSLLPFRRNLCP